MTAEPIADVVARVLGRCATDEAYADAAALAGEVERLRVLLAEGVALTKDMNWSDVGAYDWWGRAYDATREVPS